MYSAKIFPTHTAAERGSRSGIDSEDEKESTIVSIFEGSMLVEKTAAEENGGGGKFLKK